MESHIICAFFQWLTPNKFKKKSHTARGLKKDDQSNIIFNNQVDFNSIMRRD